MQKEQVVRRLAPFRAGAPASGANVIRVEGRDGRAAARTRFLCPPSLEEELSIR